MPFTALILNPIHPGAATAERELGALGEVRTYVTTPDSPGPEQVGRALSEGAGSLVVAGGDGTQRLVAGALAGTGIPLGILATGTACVYSRNLGLPRGLAGASLAMTGIPHSMDLGWASLDGGPPEPFLVATGMGRDAETLFGVRDNLKSGSAGWPTSGPGSGPWDVPGFLCRSTDNRSRRGPFWRAMSGRFRQLPSFPGHAPTTEDCTSCTSGSTAGGTGGQSFSQD